MWVSHYSTDEQSELHTLLTFYRLIVSLTTFWVQLRRKHVISINFLVNFCRRKVVFYCKPYSILEKKKKKNVRPRESNSSHIQLGPYKIPMTSSHHTNALLHYYIWPVIASHRKVNASQGTTLIEGVYVYAEYSIYKITLMGLCRSLETVWHWWLIILQRYQRYQEASNP